MRGGGQISVGGMVDRREPPTLFHQVEERGLEQFFQAVIFQVLPIDGAGCRQSAASVRYKVVFSGHRTSVLTTQLFPRLGGVLAARPGDVVLSKTQRFICHLHPKASGISVNFLL